MAGLHRQLGPRKDSVTKSGAFEVHFPIYEINRPVGKAGPVQVGITLGEHRGQSMEWNNQTPVLPQTIGTITIPGSPPISETLQLLCECPNPLGWDEYNPITLVRAVNHLRSLGKDDAIAALRAFARLAPVESSSVRHRKTASIDTTDQQRLCLIIPLLFERKNPEVKFPTNEDFSHDGSDEWWDFRVSVEDDIPFHNTKIVGRTGPPDPPRGYLVEWAAKHGKLREKPLRPADDPLAAADSLYAKLAAKEPDWHPLYEDILRTHVRHQAWRIVAPFMESERAKNWPGGLDDTEWQELKAKAERLNIRWSEERQEYVTE